MPTWRVETPGSLSEGCPCPVHCPRGILALQVPFPTGRPCPLHYPGPSWALGLLWPTSPVPRVPTKQNSPFHSHAPSRSMNSCTPPNGFRAFSRHQQQNDLLFVNLNNPLTNIKLTPGSLGWESLLPPTSHSHHAYHIRSTHTQARWPSLIPHTLSISQLTPTLYTAILPN